MFVTLGSGIAYRVALEDNLQAKTQISMMLHSTLSKIEISNAIKVGLVHRQRSAYLRIRNRRENRRLSRDTMYELDMTELY
jgi:hypothetical protein